MVITPNGTVVAFDAGPAGAACDATIDYYDSLGITEIDYFVTSHYHADHIGCVPELLARFPVTGEVIDRGGNYSTQTYKSYRKATKKDRKKARVGREIVLEQASRFSDPILLTLVAANGKSTTGKTSVPGSNQNDRGLVATISMGEFSALFGGDIAGTDSGSYNDVESIVGPAAGQTEILKVHHHGSKYSTSTAFLDQITPVVAVVSSGKTNSFGHPTADAMGRLHDAKVTSFWTTSGNGVRAVNKWDKVCNGPVVANAEPGGDKFNVTCRGKTRSYSVVEAVPLVAPGTPRNLSAKVDDSTVTLRWSAPADGGEVANYKVEVGTSSGASNYRTATTGSTSYAMSNVAEGTYYARVRAMNATGTSSATADKSFAVTPVVVPVSFSAVLDVAAETVRITNKGSSSVTMTGYTLYSTVGSQSYSFPNGYTLGGGSTVTVTSGPGAVHNPPSTLKGWSGYVWNNDGDTAQLKDPSGKVVASDTDSS